MMSDLDSPLFLGSTAANLRFAAARRESLRSCAH